jgi:hypothetical protein
MGTPQPISTASRESTTACVDHGVLWLPPPLSVTWAVSALWAGATAHAGAARRSAGARRAYDLLPPPLFSFMCNEPPSLIVRSMCAAGEEGAADGGTGVAETTKEAAAAGQAASTLHDAARVGDTHSITQLVAGGADVNGKDRLKRAPIHLAAWAGRVDTIEYLVGCGALVKIEAADGITRKLLWVVTISCSGLSPPLLAVGAPWCTLTTARVGARSAAFRMHEGSRGGRQGAAEGGCQHQRRLIQGTDASAHGCTERCVLLPLHSTH